MQENLADVEETISEVERLDQDVKFDRSIKSIMKTFLFEIGQVFPQPFYEETNFPELRSTIAPRV